MTERPYKSRPADQCSNDVSARASRWPDRPGHTSHLGLGFLALVGDRFAGTFDVATGTLDGLASGHSQKGDQRQEQRTQGHGMVSFVGVMRGKDMAQERALEIALEQELA